MFSAYPQFRPQSCQRHTLYVSFRDLGWQVSTGGTGFTLPLKIDFKVMSLPSLHLCCVQGKEQKRWRFRQTDRHTEREREEGGEGRERNRGRGGDVGRPGCSEGMRVKKAVRECGHSNDTP